MTADYLIRKYVGIPFKNRGRDLDGLDCYGLLVCVYRELGIKLFDVEEEYDAKIDAKRRNYFIKNYHREWERLDKPEFLSVICFQNVNGIGAHVGIYIGRGRFIHTIKSGTVMSHVVVWKDKVQGFYRYKGPDVKQLAKLFVAVS